VCVTAVYLTDGRILEWSLLCYSVIDCCALHWTWLWQVFTKLESKTFIIFMNQWITLSSIKGACSFTNITNEGRREGVPTKLTCPKFLMSQKNLQRESVSENFLTMFRNMLFKGILYLSLIDCHAYDCGLHKCSVYNHSIQDCSVFCILRKCIKL